MKLWGLIISLWLAVPASATTYYAGCSDSVPVGNDGNTGLSAAQPWTLTKCNNTAGAGDTVILIDGTTYTAGIGGGRFEPKTGGSAGNYITWKALNKWKAVFSGSTQEGIQPLSGVNYIILDGFKVQNVASKGIGTAANQHHFTIRNCWMTNCVGDGIGLNSNGNHDNIAEYNLVEGPSSSVGIYFSSTNNIIRNNVVRNASYYGIQGYNGYAGGWVAENQVYGNLTYGHPLQYGMTIYADNGVSGSNQGTNYVYNNTFLDGFKLRFGWCYFTNNIILPSPQNPTHPVYFATGGEPTTVPKCDYNLSIYTLDHAGAHDVVSAPGLVNTNTGLAWLKATSAARGHAAAGVTGPIDFFGNARASVSDIGFIQYSLTLENDGRVLDPSPAAGADYWALINPPSYYAGAPNSNPPGNDANDGLTAATPKTLPTALSALGPGITVWMLDGNYVGAGGGRISISKSGNIGSPAYIRAVNKWGAIVDHSTQEGMQISGTQSNLVFDGIKFQYCQADGLCLNTGCSNIVIQNIWSISNLQNGINMTDPGQMGNTIDSCMLEKNGNFTTHSYHGAYVSGQNHIVRNNVARNNAGYGIQFYTGYAGNLQHNCQFYNNLTYGQGTFHYGIADWNAVGTDGSVPGTNYFFNNTIADGMTCEYGYAGLTNNVIIPSGLSAFPIDYAIGTGREPIGVWEDYNWSTSAFYSIGAWLHKGANDTITTTSVLFRNPANGLYWIPGLGQTAAGALGSPTPVATPDFYSQPVGAQTHVGFMSFRYNLAGDVRDMVSTNFPDYWQPYVDPNAPVISGINVTVAETTAGVIWTTDEPSTSLLEWGLTVAYGSSSSDANPVVVHHRAATGLAAGTTYHFRVRSADNSGNTSVSSDGTFTTTPSPVSPPSVQFKGQVILQGEGGAIFK